MDIIVGREPSFHNSNYCNAPRAVILKLQGDLTKIGQRFSQIANCFFDFVRSAFKDISNFGLTDLLITLNPEFVNWVPRGSP